MSKEIAILGTGANGSCMAADLIDAGYDVTLIDQWPAHIEAMRADGLRIQMHGAEQHVHVRAYHLCDICTFEDKFDIVLLAMKAYDTVWACHLIEPYLQPDGLLVGTQNGMMAEAIAAIVGPSRHAGLRLRRGRGAAHTRHRQADAHTRVLVVRPRQPGPLQRRPGAGGRGAAPPRGPRGSGPRHSLGQMDEADPQRHGAVIGCDGWAVQP